MAVNNVQNLFQVAETPVENAYTEGFLIDLADVQGDFKVQCNVNFIPDLIEITFSAQSSSGGLGRAALEDNMVGLRILDLGAYQNPQNFAIAATSSVKGTLRIYNTSRESFYQRTIHMNVWDEFNEQLALFGQIHLSFHYVRFHTRQSV